MSVEDLVAHALAAPYDDDDRWERVQVLAAVATEETVAAAEALCASEDPHARELGVDVLGELGNRPDGPLRERRVAFLLGLLARETAPPVLESLAYAFSRLDEPRGAVPLSALAGHPDPRVRRAVVDGIARHDDERAIAALIALSADEVAEIRDWATFGLGTMLSTDTPEVRAALVTRLDDPYDDAREEGMYGLALRLDPRAIPVLLAFIEDDGVGPMLDSALLILTDHFDDPRLPAAIAGYWPDGIPEQARERADAELELHRMPD